MSSPRRDLFKQLFAMGALPGIVASVGGAEAFGSLFGAQTASGINPEIDPKAYDFWSGFLTAPSRPSMTGRKTRGGGQSPSAGPDDVTPVFLHHGMEGFKNAIELSPDNLVDAEDVMVSVNTSTVKIGSGDQKTFERLQNAQIRVDVAQKTSVIPSIEAMAYTLVGAMRSVQVQAKGTAAQKKAQPTVQNISVSSDATWQKMQNIPLPGGHGRWALNLEAQRKDSLFCKVLQNIVKEGGMFAPVLGLPGVALSALQSFNNLYGALHSRSVPVIQSAPLPVYATKTALRGSGDAASATGILLQSGTYILIPRESTSRHERIGKIHSLAGTCGAAEDTGAGP